MDWKAAVGVNAEASSFVTSLADCSPVKSDVLAFDGRVAIAPVPYQISEDYYPGDPADPLILEAEAMLKSLWPEMWDQYGEIVRAYYPIEHCDRNRRTIPWGCVCGQHYESDAGSMYVTIQGAGGILDGWVHELGHLKLHHMGVHFLEWNKDLLANDFAEAFVSPIRKDILRPMGAVLHAHYSYVHVTELELRAAHAGDPDVHGSLKTNVARLTEGMGTIDDNLKATNDGVDFWNETRSWTKQLLEDSNKILSL